MKNILLSGLFALTIITVKAEVRPAGILGNHMVLQRHRPVRIWGWADKGESVEITFNGQTVRTKAERDGKWSSVLNPMPHGGPYTMTIKGRKNTVMLDDILIGEVWLCAGQSNMEWTVTQSADAERETNSANYPEIRSLRVPKGIKARPQDDITAEWQVCSPETAGGFSGVAYFYGRELHRELGVPVGIINASWGGTDIETWMSDESFDALPEKVKKPYDREVANNLDFFMNMNIGRKEVFLNAMKNDPGMIEKWYDPEHDTRSWNRIEVPREWGSTPLALIDGHIWFKYRLKLLAGSGESEASLSLGTIDDSDITWINGYEVGHGSGWDYKRIYNIPTGVLKDGSNEITVRITDDGGSGGMWSRSEDIYLELKGTLEQRLPIAGEWLFCSSVANREYNVLDVSPNMLHSSLYNSMINPLTRYTIRGVVWYQGENNVGKAHDYRTLLPAMINDWRSRWGYEYPFYWVQLANLYPLDEKPAESTWAELREAQTMALSLPESGQAVTYDIGNPDDIHPLNKQEVGRRLALIAFAKTYGKERIVYSGPTFRSVEIRSNKMIISFDNTGTGLHTPNRHGHVEGFAVASEKGGFEWANAEIEGNKVTVWSNRVEKPAYVRYAWGNNPGANLYNKEGLPATPFRTDDRKGITEE